MPEIVCPMNTCIDCDVGNGSGCLYIDTLYFSNVHYLGHEKGVLQCQGYKSHYTCYSCGESEVSKEEHESVKQEFEEMTDAMNAFVTEYLGLVHCTGPEEMFDRTGAVVVCSDCLANAKESFQDTEMHDE